MTGKRKRSTIRGRSSSSVRPMPTLRIEEPGVGIESARAAIAIGGAWWQAQHAAAERDQFGGRA